MYVPYEKYATITVPTKAVTTVAVIFPANLTDKRYTYKVPTSLCYSLKAGDHVVVDSPSSGPTVVEVVEVNPTSGRGTKFVMSKVDLTEYNNNKQREERAKLIQADIEREKKKAKEKKEALELAPFNPKLTALLKELDDLESQGF